jgi:hypothetical protein
MNEHMIEDMLAEIDLMSAEEYWSLYQDAQRLSDFIPDIPWEPIAVPAFFADNTEICTNYPRRRISI